MQQNNLPELIGQRQKTQAEAHGNGTQDHEPAHFIVIHQAPKERTNQPGHHLKRKDGHHGVPTTDPKFLQPRNNKQSETVYQYAKSNRLINQGKGNDIPAIV